MLPVYRYCLVIIAGLFLITGHCYAQNVTILSNPNYKNGDWILRVIAPPDVDTCMKELPLIVNAAVDSFSITGDAAIYSNGKIKLINTGVFYLNVFYNEKGKLKQPIAVGPPLPPVVLSITPSSTTNCEGEMVTYKANVYAGIPNLTKFQWQINGVDAGPNAMEFTTNALKSNDNLTLTATNFGVCQSPTRSKTIVIPIQQPSVTHMVTVTASENPVCGEHAVTYTASTNNQTPGMAYQWRVNGIVVDGNQPTYTRAKVKDGDEVTCTIGNLGKCILPVTSAVLKVRVGEIPTVKLAGNAAIGYGNAVQLKAVTTGSISSYQWLPAKGLSNATIANPIASPASSTRYKLTVTSADGCTAEAITLVKVSIIVTNTFTPNGDGVNDTWEIPAITNNTDYTVDVYNRLGGVVFQAKTYTKNWDGTHNGKALAPGTYYYLIKNKVDGGQFAGNINIIR